MVDYGAAIKRPFTNIVTLVISIIIGAIPFAGLLLIGYGLQSGQYTLNNRPELPSWSEIVDILVKTVVGIVVFIIYMIPTIILFIIGGLAVAGALVTAAMSGTVDPTAILAILAAGSIPLTIGGILLILAILVLPMAFMQYLKNGFGAAFNIGSVIKNCLTGAYIITLIVFIVYAVILSMVLLAIGGALVIATMLIPILSGIIGAIFLSLLVYILLVTASTMFAQTYTEVSTGK